MTDEDHILSRFLMAAFGAWRSVAIGGITAGLLAGGATFLVRPTYTARVLLMPPQQQSGTSALLGSLGSLAGIAGAAAGLKNTADVYVSLMQSVTISDKIIDRFELLKVYEEDLRVDARKELGKNVAISVGKKDGILSIEVDDHEPVRAASIANAYVDELRLLTNSLAVSEAQQRRKFFEQKLQETKEKLVDAQLALERSGFGAGVLKVEPKSLAEGYAKLKTEIVAAEVRLQMMRTTLTDATPEVRVLQNQLTAMRAELARQEGSQVAPGDTKYVSLYRDFKYQETLFEMYAKQFELARADESREGALIQVIDTAAAPEKKSKPKRAVVSILAAMLTAFGLLMRAGFRGVNRQ